MAIAVGEDPYVHSNEERFRFNAGAGEDYGAMSNALQSKDIQASIDELIKIRNSLKVTADDFLMGMEVKEVNAELLKNPNTYAGIATRIIQSGDLAETLFNGEIVSRNDIEDLMNDNKYHDIIMKKIGRFKDSIALNKMTQIIIDSFEKDIHGEIDQTGTKLQNFFKLDSNNLKEELEQLAGKHIYEHYKPQADTIKNIIKDALRHKNLVSGGKKTISQSIEQFMELFSSRFLNEVSSIINFYDTDQTPEQYLSDLKKQLTNQLTHSMSTMRSAVGEINESVLVSVYRADKATIIKMEATGSMSDKEIIEKFGKDLNLKLNNFHEENKQSQTDILITNKKGMTVRAQSKTSLKDSYTIENPEIERICNYLQRTVNIKTLFTNLERTQMFAIKNKEQIYYVLANALWFNTHESISGIREEGQLTHKEGQTYPDILPNVIEAINIELAKRIPPFLGVAVKETSKEITADAQASNIFYIENGNLVPTYLELDEVINDLRHYQEEINKVTVRTQKSMEFTINTNINWPIPNAVDLWLAKYGTGAYNPGPGTKQGAAAISGITIEGRFDAILRFSAYTIGK